MKYIISEEQQDRIKKRMLELLKNYTKDSKVICDIKIYEVDEEEYDYEIEKGLKYDIHMILDERYVKTGGIYGFTTASKKKVEKILSTWFGLKPEEYYVTVYAKECEENTYLET
jgi:hypothetical protein